MSDRDVFERRFEEAVREYVEAAPTEIDAARLTHALATDVPRVRRLVSLPPLRMPRLGFAWILVAIGLLVLIGLGAVASGALRNVPPAPAPPNPQPRESLPAAITSPAIATSRLSVPASTGSPIQIGIVLPAAFKGTGSEQFQVALEAEGYSAEIVFSQDVATEKSAVEALISRGIKVLILGPQDGATAAAAANEARTAGIKVISYARMILDTASVDYYVAFDHAAVGAAQAQYLVDRAGASKGNNLYLYGGASSDDNSFGFLEGAWETLQPRIVDGTFVIRNSSDAVRLEANAVLTREEQQRILGQVTTNWDASTARIVAVSNLAVLPPAAKGIVFILAPNDNTARVIADAFAADPDVTKVYVTGQDAEQASVQAIIDGRQGMTVFKDPRVLVTDAVAAAVAFLGGGTPVTTATDSNGTIDVPSRLPPIVAVTKDNIQEALIDSGYYQTGDFTGTWPGRR